MKVSISVGGKFHAFYLAEQLQNKGHLLQLITSVDIHRATDVVTTKLFPLLPDYSTLSVAYSLLN